MGLRSKPVDKGGSRTKIAERESTRRGGGCSLQNMVANGAGGISSTRKLSRRTFLDWSILSSGTWREKGESFSGLGRHLSSRCKEDGFEKYTLLLCLRTGRLRSCREERKGGARLAEA